MRDSNPGLEPEDHMEKSWLVDKEGVMQRLPGGCHAIGEDYLSFKAVANLLGHLVLCFLSPCSRS